MTSSGPPRSWKRTSIVSKSLGTTVFGKIVFGILRGLGREVEYVRYPEEFHIMVATGRPDRRVDRLERILDWFERYL